MGRPKGVRDADYPAKRAELIRRMSMLVLRRQSARPSFRQLAQAAGVSVPTLRYYFEDRNGAVVAVFEGYFELGFSRLRSLAEPMADLDTSVRDFCKSLVFGLRAPREIRLGDVFAVAIAEGLMEPGLGPATLRFLIDPSVAVLQARLDHHLAVGEMIACDTRAAALMLLSPILIALLHQDHLGGAATSPVDIDALMDEICSAFLRAYGRS